MHRQDMAMNDAPSWDVLPLAVLKLIVKAIEEDSWRAILRNVSKPLAANVDLVREEEGTVVYSIDAEAVCSSSSVLRWAVITCGCPRSSAVTSAAVRSGHLDTLRTAMALELPLHPHMSVDAAEQGHLPMLQELLSQPVPYSSQRPILNENVFAAAANNGHLSVLEWLMEQNCPFRPTVCMEAAMDSNFDAIRWLFSKGCDLEIFSCTRRGCPVGWAAARDGDLDFLEWVMHNGGVINEDTCWGAASTGQISALRWLRETAGCPWDFQTMSAAAGGGHLDVFLWCHDQGAPWNRESACMEAAAGGNVELMKVVRQLGCVWTGDEFLPAITTGNIALLAWMKEDGCPWPIDGGWVKAVAHAFHCGQGEVMSWLEDQLNATPVEDRTLEWEMRREAAQEMLGHLRGKLERTEG